jgi:hypothetical protein
MLATISCSAVLVSEIKSPRCPKAYPHPPKVGPGDAFPTRFELTTKLPDTIAAIEAAVFHLLCAVPAARGTTIRSAPARPYLGAIIDPIVVSENTIRITGSNDNRRLWFVNLVRNGAPF